MPDGIEIDTSAFNKFARDLKRAEPALAKSLRTNLKLAGELVAVDARARAGFSSRIPGKIKVGVAGKRIRVYVQKIPAPHAGEERAFEHGGRGGKFRHPVFGGNNWVAQEAKPFLRPAALAGRVAVERAAKRAVDDAMRELKSHG